MPKPGKYSKQEKAEMQKAFQDDQQRATEAWGSDHAIMILSVKEYLRITSGKVSSKELQDLNPYDEFHYQLLQAADAFKKNWSYVVVDFKTYMLWLASGKKLNAEVKVVSPAPAEKKGKN